MPRLKSNPVEKLSIEDAISNGVSELKELGEELREWSDNIAEKFQAKSETIGEVADTLENIDEPEVVEELQFITVEVVTQVKASKKSPYPRWLRLSNAIAHLQSVVDALDNLDDDDDVGGEGSKVAEGVKELAESLRDDVQTIIDDCEGLEMPSMFGG